MNSTAFFPSDGAIKGTGGSQPGIIHNKKTHRKEKKAMKTLAEIIQRLSEIRTEMENEDADIEALTRESQELLKAKEAIESKNKTRAATIALVEKGLAGTPVSDEPDDDDTRSGTVPTINRDMRRSAPPKEIDMNARSKRAKELVERGKFVISGAEQRAIILNGGHIATPTKVSGINDIPGVVSSIVDMVTVEDCTGMDSDKVAYQVTEATASAVTEGVAPTTSEPTFNYVTISPSVWGLMAYVGEQIRNQSPLDYESKVINEVRKALRKKAAEKIKDAVYGSELADELQMTAIGADTLRKIAFNYSADSIVDGNAVLFLNKTDLIAFGDVRGTNEKKAVYEITADPANPNTGTIKDGGLTVKYCILPDCTALTGTTNSSTTATKPTMFYGNPYNIKLDLFGGMKVGVSEDYKFAEGLLSVRGTASFGVGMVVSKGMMLISLPKASG